MLAQRAGGLEALGARAATRWSSGDPELATLGFA
jgi:hypothetical protein